MLKVLEEMKVMSVLAIVQTHYTNDDILLAGRDVIKTLIKQAEVRGYRTAKYLQE